MQKNNAYHEVDKSNPKVTHINEFKDILVPNEKARARMALAFIEDEEVRNESIANSKAYLKLKWKKEDSMPNWMWNFLYFILGALFLISMENVFWNWDKFIIQ